MAKKEKATKEKMPSVLSYEKKLLPSSAQMYGTQWEKRNDPALCIPLKVVEASLRGTISNRIPLKKFDTEAKKSNLKKVDTCSLAQNQDTLKVSFTLKVLGDVDVPSTCNNTFFRDQFKECTENYIENHGFKELGYRYAHNLANARFLWRNRAGAETIEVRVRCEYESEIKSFRFNAKELSIREFNEDDNVKELGDLIAKTLCSKGGFLLLKVDAFAKMGDGQDVYPSEVMVLDKGKLDKNKTLHSEDGIASMTTQKIGNAIRTIDTWYPDYDLHGVGPIPVEPFGVITEMGAVFRTLSGKKDFYTLFDSYSRGGELESKEDEHFVMSVIIRGGIFGESGKE
jgi:CRISPR-associated protein Csy3